MGGIGSKPKSSPPEGCYFTQDDTSIPPIGFINWLNFGRAVDCDCRSIDACPAAPPPHPPLEQFLRRSTPADLYAECKFNDGPRQRTFTTGGWHIVGGWDQEEKKDEFPDLFKEPHDKREDEWKSLTQRSVQRYETLALAAYRSMPRRKREALRRHFADRMPSYFQHESSNTVGGIDDVVMLSILLGEPDKWANRVMRHLPEHRVETLLVCAEYAVSRGHDRISAVLAARDAAGRGWLRKIGLRSLTVDEPAYMQQAAKNFLQSLPHLKGGLTTRVVNNEAPSTSHSNDRNGTCALVYQRALTNFDTATPAGQYVAGYVEIMSALNRQGHEGNNSRLLEALRHPSPPNWRMDWAEENMRNIYGAEFPAVAVGMNFMALSLHASSQGLLTAFY